VEVHSVRSWYDQHHGVVVVEDDVQNVVRDIKAISPRIHVYSNPQTSGFDLVESCLDGTDRLVFSVQQLDQRVVDRLRSADHWHGQDVPNHVLGEDEDVTARVDAHNREMEELQKEKFRDQLYDAGERLAWALDIGGPSVRSSILVPKDIDG